VLERLAAQTSFSASRELALALRPSIQIAEVRERQQQTAEGRFLVNKGNPPTFGGVRDVRPVAAQAALGRILEPGELLDVETTISAGRRVKGNLTRQAHLLPELSEIAKGIADLLAVSGEIARCINDRGEVLDAASPQLHSVRQELRVAHDRLLERVRRALGDAVRSGAAQEDLFTQRDGRYVIPVKADYRGQVRGVVHDVSSSGATVFIEPLGVVELGNRWRELQLEEQREVQRILRALSQLVGDAREAIDRNVDLLARLDLALAKGRLAEQMQARDLPSDNAEQPWLAESGELRLMHARHPLLTGEVVPIDLAVGGDYSVLLITGPNTGGKTVALKTAGLLVLMAQAGLGVPAWPGSRVPVYRSVFADIGDEQSIEQSLSTFSSHVSRIIRILDGADERSLVLLDELGAGTDPTEGAMLARALIEELLEAGCTLVATTHHSELKVFAHQDERVANASVEFNLETLSPTYRLVIGLPGKSNALAIASRLGMRRSVIQRAQARLGTEHVEMEDLLDRVRRERDLAEDERVREQEARRESEQIRRGLQERLDRIEDERERVLLQAQDEVEAELGAVREELRQAARHARRGVTPDEIARSQEVLKEMETRLAQMGQRARRRSRRRSERAPVLTPDRLEAGDYVWLRGFPQPGEVVSEPDQRGEFEVQLGALRTRAKVDQVEKHERPRAQATPERRAVSLPSVQAPDLEFDMRGQTWEEALPRLERVLEQGSISGLPYVRIIHGKGTGALRRYVRDLLRNHPLVSSFEHPEPAAGGEGVTIAHLAG
jgi:DNA mismatch repair protein MutS2